MDDTESAELGKSFANPWSVSTIKDLLQKKNPQILKYDVSQFSNILFQVKNLNWC